MRNRAWIDVREKMPNFVVDGELIQNLPVEVRRADGTELKTIYQGFGHWGYAPDYLTDVTHWKLPNA